MAEGFFSWSMMTTSVPRPRGNSHRRATNRRGRGRFGRSSVPIGLLFFLSMMSVWVIKRFPTHRHTHSVCHTHCRSGCIQPW